MVKYKMWELVLALFITLWILYMVTKEKFGGLDPNATVRILAAIHRYPQGPASLRNVNYALFSQAILPTTIHEWTFQELQNLSVNNMLNVPNVRFLLSLDAKYATHPALRPGGSPIMYPTAPAKPNVNNFVINVGTNENPKWIVKS